MYRWLRCGLVRLGWPRISAEHRGNFASVFAGVVLDANLIPLLGPGQVRKLNLDGEHEGVILGGGHSLAFHRFTPGDRSKIEEKALAPAPS